MKKKFVNSEEINGYVYQRDLAEKTVQDPASKNFGKPFISGSLLIATDEDGLNVVKVHYTYVAEQYGSGSPNRNYNVLKEIMEGATWIKDGKDAALKVKLTPSLSLNDFYDNNGELVSNLRNEGGFVSIISALPEENKRTKFEADMVITGAKRVEANEEKETPEYLELRGAIFDFRQAVLPVTFHIKNPQGIDYFEGLEPSSSNPVFTKVWGKIVSETIKQQVKSETAFGEALVKTIEKNNKEYLITGTDPEPGIFNDESTITAEELTKAMQDREVYLAGVKKRTDEYKAKKNENSSGAQVQTGRFNF